MKYLKWLPITIILLLFSYISFFEYWTLGIVADQEVINRYPFGSEGPVAGRWAYKNVENYVRMSLVAGGLSFSLALLFFIYRKAKSAPLYMVMYIFSFLTIFLTSLL